jgi:hypothetical protein
VVGPKLNDDNRGWRHRAEVVEATYGITGLGHQCGDARWLPMTALCGFLWWRWPLAAVA